MAHLPVSGVLSCLQEMKKPMAGGPQGGYHDDMELDTVWLVAAHRARV